MDSAFKNVDIVLLVKHKNKVRPGVLLDNLDTSTAKVVVQEAKGNIILQSMRSPMWGLGAVFADHLPKQGVELSGPISPVPDKPDMLLKDGEFFRRSKPQYLEFGQDRYSNILEWGVRNDGSISFAPQNAILINIALQRAAENNQIVVFPAGIYAVDNTINIPINSRILGACGLKSWQLAKDFQILANQWS